MMTGVLLSKERDYLEGMLDKKWKPIMTKQENEEHNLPIHDRLPKRKPRLLVKLEKSAHVKEIDLCEIISILKKRPKLGRHNLPE